MNVTLISCFRNAESYLNRYFNQVAELFADMSQNDHEMSLIWGEGDSIDNTLEQLRAFQALLPHRITLVDCTHGGRADYEGVINEQRFKELAYVGNCMWQHIPANADAIVYVESDLIWAPETILALIDRLRDYPAISPMVYLRRRGWEETAFYDTWAARINGKHFEHYPPYIDGFDPNKPFRVDSMGSCMAFHGELSRKLCWDERVFVGICQDIYALGASVWIDPQTAIYHQ